MRGIRSCGEIGARFLERLYRNPLVTGGTGGVSPPLPLPIMPNLKLKSKFNNMVSLKGPRKPKGIKMKKKVY